MADDVLQFQAGREAAIAGKPRDARRSADWLEGYDFEAHYSPSHKKQQTLLTR